MRFTIAIACVIAVLVMACASDPSAQPQQFPTIFSVRAEGSTTTTPTPPANHPPIPQPGESAATAAETASTPLPLTTEQTLQPGSTAVPTASAEVPNPTSIHSRLPKKPIPLFVHVASIPAELPEYTRRDWNHWTDADRDCQYARNEVLIEESLSTVTFSTGDRCRVATGRWLASYTNTVVTDPGKIDIDHMVPLDNAHQSGAWQWSAERKELYANYLDDPQHLIAVTASANRSKGARAPDTWKPKDQSYWCQYAIDWVSIKNTWHLTVTEPEYDALAVMLATCENPHVLTVSPDNSGTAPSAPRATSTPVPPPLTPTTTTYASCETAQAAGETRIQGSQGNGPGFPKSMVPSARDSDGDGVVCER